MDATKKKIKTRQQQCQQPVAAIQLVFLLLLFLHLLFIIIIIYFSILCSLLSSLRIHSLTVCSLLFCCVCSIANVSFFLGISVDGNDRMPRWLRLVGRRSHFFLLLSTTEGWKKDEKVKNVKKSMLFFLCAYTFLTGWLHCSKTNKCLQPPLRSLIK